MGILVNVSGCSSCRNISATIPTKKKIVIRVAQFERDVLSRLKLLASSAESLFSEYRDFLLGPFFTRGFIANQGTKLGLTHAQAREMEIAVQGIKPPKQYTGITTAGNIEQYVFNANSYLTGCRDMSNVLVNAASQYPKFAPALDDPGFKNYKDRITKLINSLNELTKSGVLATAKLEATKKLEDRGGITGIFTGAIGKTMWGVAIPVLITAGVGLGIWALIKGGVVTKLIERFKKEGGLGETES